MLDVGQAQELKLAFRREGDWTNEDIKALTERKGLLRQILGIVRGFAEITVKKIGLWRRFLVGGISRDELITKLDEVGVANTGLTFRVSDYAKDLMAQKAFVISKEKMEADFVIATPKDLGFTENPTTEELFNEKNLAFYGLELCRADDGPSIRLSYTDQPNSEWLPIAMKPICASDGYWDVFGLGRFGSELWLYGRYGAEPQGRWDVGDRLVFRARKF